MSEIKNSYWPQVIEQTARGERSFDLASRMLQERIILDRKSVV